MKKTVLILLLGELIFPLISRAADWPETLKANIIDNHFDIDKSCIVYDI